MKICECCGAKIIEYKHGLNKVLIQALVKFYKAGGKCSIMDFDMNFNERNNFQKLKHWGIIYRHEGSNIWEVTKKGRGFLYKENPLPRYVFTYRNKVESFSEERVFIDEVKDYIHDKEYFREQVRDYKQQSLFKE